MFITDFLSLRLQQLPCVAGTSNALRSDVLEAAEFTAEAHRYACGYCPYDDLTLPYCLDSCEPIGKILPRPRCGSSANMEKKNMYIPTRGSLYSCDSSQLRLPAAGWPGANAKPSASTLESSWKTPTGATLALVHSLTMPSDSAICRASFQAACVQKGKCEAAAASRRRQQDSHARHVARKQAVAWRHACEQRALKEQEQLRLEAEEEAKHIEKKQHKDLQWDRIVMRLNDRPNRERNTNPKENSTATLSADERIEGVRRLKREASRQARRAQLQEEQKKQFESMPLIERTTIENAVSLCNQEERGLTDAATLANCLHELGLRGTCPTQRRAVHRICENAFFSKQNVEAEAERRTLDIYRFAVKIVPDVRRQLAKLHSVALHQSFSQCKRDAHGAYEFDGVVAAIDCFFPFHICSRHDEIFCDLWEDVLQNMKEFVKNEDFMNFSGYVSMKAEVAHRIVAALQRTICIERKLDKDIFNRFRSELVQLDRLFSSADVDKNNFLDKQECIRILTKIGIMPTSCKARDYLREAFGEDSERGFNEFLELISSVRSMLAVHTEEFLKDSRWRTETIPLVGLTQFLEEIGIVPATSIVSAVIRDLDIDATDHYSHDDVKLLCQRAHERMRQSQREAEVDLAHNLQFSTEELDQIRFAFSELDVDGSGSLEPTELVDALVLMNIKSPSSTELYSAMQEVDTDGNGSIDLCEFMCMLKNFRDREGAFAAAGILVSRPDELSRNDLVHLLKCFDVDTAVLNSMTDTELLTMVCDSFQIGPSDNFKPNINISTLQDLFNWAKRMHKWATFGHKSKHT